MAGTLKLDKSSIPRIRSIRKIRFRIWMLLQKAVIDKGKRNVEILKQPQYSPLTVENKIAIILFRYKGLLRNVEGRKVKTFESDLLAA